MTSSSKNKMKIEDDGMKIEEDVVKERRNST